MSRLIVKNLPAYLTQQRLRAHFEGADGPGGTLTDVKLVLKPDGTSRRFGFIGYKTPAEAERAKKWFNKTFIDSSRIDVNIVDGAKDAPSPRPNKRPRLGPSPAEEQHGDHSAAQVESSSSKKTKPVPSLDSPTKKPADEHLKEFMQVMQPRTKKGPSWANEEPLALLPVSSVTNPVDDDLVSKSRTRVKGDVEVEDFGDVEGEQKDAGISDLDWLKQRTKPVLDYTNVEGEKVFEQSDDDESDAKDGNAEVVQNEAPQDPAKVTILQTSRLFLRNLAFTCTEEDIRQLFASFGEISQVHIPLDPVTKQSKGLAYVLFVKATSALSAFETLDRTSFQGRLLHILPAVNRKGKTEEGDGGRKKTLKEEREVMKKAGAGKEFNWAMLYMNSDAVASSVADRMNISKADILNPESDNAAVKLALAETHIVNETKAFLESHGVVLSSFSPPANSRPQRSDTVLLVKNIPYGTSVDTLRTLFGAHGELRRVLVPPAGTLAVVEFEHASDARTAFRALAYRRLGNSVMYLEKAPLGMFAEGAEAPGETGSTGAPWDPVVATAVAPIKAPVDTDTLVGTGAKNADAAEAEPPLSAGTTLFVKNLAFSTTSAGLVQALQHLPGFAFARVQTKADPARPAARLSMGYGFVGFRTKDEARRGLRSLEGFILDGHVLTVKWAGRGMDEGEGEAGAEAKGKPKSAKMVIKNVPFEATKKDIRELFGAHAQLKSVRLPRKFDRRTRGFAFLEFVSPHEAARAYASLRHTHLLGRHLVLEWAEDGAADIEELRKKAGVGFGGGKELPGRKRKLEFAEGDNDEEEA